MNTITRQKYERSAEILIKLNPLIAALGINSGNLFDCKESLQQMDDFKELIYKTVSKHKEVISLGDKQYENRPKKLITDCLLTNSGIPNDILKAEAELKHYKDVYADKMAELTKKGFTDAEIKKILPSELEEKEHFTKFKISGLKGESKKFLEFVNDAPCFDIEILKGTRLYPKK
jgi:hypothetical protein